MIYHIIENTCYQSLTNGLAIPNMAKQLGIPCKSYTLSEFLSSETKQNTSKDAIFITESAFLRGNRTLNDVRALVPNGKIVNLGSDTILFRFQGKDEIDYISELDLWLDTMPECVGYYKNKGTKADLWDWTISEAYITQIEKFQYHKRETKTCDLIFLANLNSEYRQKLYEYLIDNNISCMIGRGTIS